MRVVRARGVRELVESHFDVIYVLVTCWGLLHSRRSCKKKHLRKISTEITPKLPPRGLWHNDMP
jgi:hypothetical protein